MLGRVVMSTSALHCSEQMWCTTNKVERNCHEHQTDDERCRVDFGTLGDEKDEGDENEKRTYA
jgi:Cft2 family RNA processing exonuclease